MEAADPPHAAERAARDSYGRLLAYLSARTRDVAAAEDALSDAFAAAVATWPKTGTPNNPEAWLMKAARRKLVDGARRAQVRRAAEPDLSVLTEEASEIAEAGRLPDKRLQLMLVCAHPAIDAASRTPLMLQTVLGVDAARIASVFLMSPAAMSQRLVRAKAKIKDAGIPFDLAEARLSPDRLAAVLAAVYAAYSLGWEDVETGGDVVLGFAAEAEWLARLIVRLAPEDAEAKGLLALILFCESRRAARRSPGGDFVPLDQQDVRLWRGDQMTEAQALLAKASEQGRLGRFQLEAAIQSAHARRADTGETDWRAIASLYRMLNAAAPSLGAEVGRAAALGEAEGPEAGLRILDALPDRRIATYQPYWAVRAHLLARMNDIPGARHAFQMAAGLTDDPAVSAYLIGKLGELG